MSKPTTFAAWFKGVRLRQGLTQEEVALRGGFDDSYINKIEKGHIKLPLYETRARIHAALGTTEEEPRDLGIVPVTRDAHGYATVGTATAAGGTHTATAGDARLDKVRTLYDQLPDGEKTELIGYLKWRLSLYQGGERPVD